jgi:phosphomannomutase
VSAKLDLLRPRSQKVKQDMLDKLVALREKVTIGIVGGSDINKQYEQLGETGMSYLAFASSVDPLHLTSLAIAVLKDFDYVFSENGLNAFKDGETLAVQVTHSSRCEDRKACFRAPPLSEFYFI